MKRINLLLFSVAAGIVMVMLLPIHFAHGSETVFIEDDFLAPTIDQTEWHFVGNSANTSYHIENSVITLDSGTTGGGGLSLRSHETFNLISQNERLTLEIVARWDSWMGIGFWSPADGIATFATNRLDGKFYVQFLEDEPGFVFERHEIPGIDTTQWHTYTFTFENGTAFFYVDRDLKHVQTDAISPNPLILRITAGSIAGEHNTIDVDYVRVYSEPIPPPNTPPTADDDSYSTDEDASLSVSATGVLDNDFDPDGDSLNAVLDTSTSNGNLTLNDDGSFDYTPATNFCGTDHFSYLATDALANSNPAIVTITVNCVNDPPEITIDQNAISVDEGQLAVNSGTVTDIDSAEVTLSASVGTIVDNSNGSWSWTFASQDGPVQSQTVTITADDGGGGTAQVSFELSVLNLPPVAVANTSQTMLECSADGVTVTLDGSGSSDPAGAADPLSYIWTGPFPEGGGTVTGVNPSVILNGLGSRTISLVIDDGDGGSDTDGVVLTLEDTIDPVVTAALVPLNSGDDDNDDEDRYRVEFSATDQCDSDLHVKAILKIKGYSQNITVTNGQIIEFDHDDDSEVEYDDGILEIEAPKITLKVTAKDDSGNKTIAKDVLKGSSDDDD